jgi:tetratricopeptide (TPR) repeat protein
MGDLKSAHVQYTTSLEERPGYAPALAGLGRLAATEGRYPEAIQYYQQADSLLIDYTFKDELIDLYRLSGDTKKADALSKAMVQDHERCSRSCKRR